MDKLILANLGYKNVTFILRVLLGKSDWCEKIMRDNRNRDKSRKKN